MYRFYSKSTTEQPNRVTVVGTHENNELKIAVSRCSIKDRFIKKKGKAMAEGRLAKGKLFDIINTSDCDSHRFVEIAKITVKRVNSTKKPINIIT